MTPLVWIKSAVKLIVLPPTGPLLAALVALAFAGRHPRAGRWIAMAAVASLLLMSLPVVGTLLVYALDRSQSLDLSTNHGAQAVVILGGGVRRQGDEYGGPTLNGLTLERVRYGARVARAVQLPVLVSGGSLRDLPAEAPLMRDALVKEYGVTVRWVEQRSTNTHENAVYSAVILKSNGVDRVILVGHSFDFPRIRNEFEAEGVKVVPAPIASASLGKISFRDFMPGLGGLQLSYFACYEFLANALYAIAR